MCEQLSRRCCAGNLRQWQSLCRARQSELLWEHSQLSHPASPAPGTARGSHGELLRAGSGDGRAAEPTGVRAWPGWGESSWIRGSGLAWSQCTALSLSVGRTGRDLLTLGIYTRKKKRTVLVPSSLSCEIQIFSNRDLICRNHCLQLVQREHTPLLV